jgi:hypothetical protein
MHPVEYRARQELPVHGRRLGSFLLTGYALLDPLIGTGVVEVRLDLLHNPVQVAFVENDEVSAQNILRDAATVTEHCIFLPLVLPIRSLTYCDRRHALHWHLTSDRRSIQ